MTTIKNELQNHPSLILDNVVKLVQIAVPPILFVTDCLKKSE